MIFLYLTLTIQILIRHWNDTLFMCDTVNDINWGRKEVSCSKSESTQWIDERLSNGNVILHSPLQEDEVLDINRTTDELLLFGIHGGLNQQFLFEQHRTGAILIKSEFMCLEYIPDIRSYKRTGCTDSDLQKFEILPDGYKYEVPEGHFTDRSGSLGSTSRDIRNHSDTMRIFGGVGTSADGRAGLMSGFACNCPPQIFSQPPPLVISNGTKIVSTGTKSAVSSLSGSMSASASRNSNLVSGGGSVSSSSLASFN